MKYNTSSKTSPKRKEQGKRMVDAIKRTLETVVHSVKRKLYVPNSVSQSTKNAVYPKFDLVNMDEFKSICLTATALLRKDATLVEVDAPVKIFGDIHGQIFDLVQMFRLYGTPSHRIGDINICNYVFAGDFVDRGAYSLEVLTVLMCLKIRYHPHVVLLRGNHEDEWANERYGFHKEMKERLSGELDIDELKHHILALFQRLPLAAVIGERILCVHGGPGLHVKTLKEIEDIRLPFAYPVHYMMPNNETQRKVVDLLWSDPINVSGLNKNKDLNLERGKWSGPGYNDHRNNGTHIRIETDSFCLF